LALQGCEELHKILGLGMELLELGVDLLEVLKTEAVIAGILVTFLHYLEYLLYWLKLLTPKIRLT